VGVTGAKESSPATLPEAPVNRFDVEVALTPAGKPITLKSDMSLKPTPRVDVTLELVWSTLRECCGNGGVNREREKPAGSHQGYRRE